MSRIEEIKARAEMVPALLTRSDTFYLLHELAVRDRAMEIFAGCWNGVQQPYGWALETARNELAQAEGPKEDR